jgi:hypothetical protein
LCVTEKRPEQAAQVLYQAADVLEHLGWCGRALERDEQRCAVGAIVAASNQGDIGSEDYANSFSLRDCAVKSIIGTVESRLNGLKEGDEISLMDWNDSATRSRQKVVGLLRSVAAPQSKTTSSASRQKTNISPSAHTVAPVTQAGHFTASLRPPSGR